MSNELRIIVSGDGTGGHIFPAISIVNAIKAKRSDAKILSVGAIGRMKMKRVPKAGYKIKELPICGFDRGHLLKSISMLFKIWKSQRMARAIIKDFKPVAAIGVGGYASGSALSVCAKRHIPCLIQGQNSHARITDKLLAKKADKICMAYEGMKRFFSAGKIVVTGNPVWRNMLQTALTQQEARKSFGLDPDRKTALSVGGNLRARTINESVVSHLDMVRASGVQFIQQTGKCYFGGITKVLQPEEPLPILHVTDFTSDTGAAYKAADLVINRAGASSISEFCLIGKPVILIPSPSVAEGHRTKNTMVLVSKNVAIYVKDSEAKDILLQQAIETVRNDSRLASLSENILRLALPHSADIVTGEVIELASSRQTKTPVKKNIEHEGEHPPMPMSEANELPATFDNSTRQKKRREMDITEIRSVYFIGADGVGMSAIARYFIHKDVVVADYDKTPSALANQLEKEGVLIHYEEGVEEVPHACRNPQTCLVTYTPAIPEAHQELKYFRENGFEIQKRAQVLGTLTQARKGLYSAGAYGKTTTSTICAYIMHQSHVDRNTFLDGISKNCGINCILSDTSNYIVIGANKFDRSFHQLCPWMSVITFTDPDHLDIYGTKEAYLESFRHYTTLIQPGGALTIRRDLEMKPAVREGTSMYDYSRDKGDFHAENTEIKSGHTAFNFISPLENIKGVELSQPILIDIENGMAAIAMTQLSGCTAEELRYGVSTHHGVERRFDFRTKNDRCVPLSGYAHRPKEIYRNAKSLRELYHDRKVAAIFQPHLYTRTGDFYKEFAGALSQLNEVILCDIYPARKQPIRGVTSQLIYDELTCKGKNMIHKEEVLDLVKRRDFNVLVILGAGDLNNYVPQMAKIIENK